MSSTVSTKPARRKLRAIGRPIRPRPTKPIRCGALTSACDIGRLDLGVEFGGVAALFARAIARGLSATEGNVEIEPRGRKVDHRQSRLRVALEVPRMFQRRRADPRRKAEFGVVRDRQ